MDNKKKKQQQQRTARSSKSRVMQENKPSKRDYGTEVSSDSARSTDNDISWYSKNKQLLQNACNLSFGNPVGAVIDHNGIGPKVLNRRIAGIMSLGLVTGPGYSGSRDSAANIAAKNIYSFIRQANSGGKNYDPNDLMSYLLAVDEAYMLFYDGVRALGMINSYNTQNRYAPKALLNAAGWNYEDLIQNIADFRYYINAFSTRMNAFAVPANWSLYKRHAWLYSNVYLDGTGSKAQMYVFKPTCYRVRNDATGALETYSLDNKRLTATTPTQKANQPVFRTFAQYREACDTVFQALINSEDVGVISGDILKAFNGGMLHLLPVVADGYVVVPTYNREVLDQIHNATILSGVYNADITMDNAINAGNVVYAPRTGVQFVPPTTSGATPYTYKEVRKIFPLSNAQLIDFKTETVTPEQVMIGTRLTAGAAGLFYESDGKTPVENEDANFAIGSMLALDVSATEVVSNVDIYTLLDSGNTQVRAVTQLNNGEVSAYSMFDWSPIRYIGTITSDHNKPLEGGVFGDLENYGLVDLGTLHNIHDTAILSEFDVPVQNLPTTTTK